MATPIAASQKRNKASKSSAFGDSVSSEDAHGRHNVALFAILALTFLFVLMPFLFWQATWFGRPLDRRPTPQNP